jgi:nicotinic acid mononucleotide adenylyltransferase
MKSLKSCGSNRFRGGANRWNPFVFSCRNSKKPLLSWTDADRYLWRYFNPVHNGHSKLAEDTFRPALDRLYYYAIIPPHKLIAACRIGPTGLQCAAGIRHEPQCEVSDLKLKREGKSHTVDTLEQLAMYCPSDRLFLIMAANCFAPSQLACWHEFYSLQ